MSRELKRVPLDFKHPRHKVWPGYLTPFAHRRYCRNCRFCEGTGNSPIALELYKKWWARMPFDPRETGSRPWRPDDIGVYEYIERKIARDSDYYGVGPKAVHRESVRMCGLWNERYCHHLSQSDVDMLVENGQLGDTTHTWKPGVGWQRVAEGERLTAAEVNHASLFQTLGHSSSVLYALTEDLCSKAGMSTKCRRCAGTGIVWRSARTRAMAGKWRRTEPPVGEGYQMWETTSEGSPISPVFKTPESLALWCVKNPYYPGSATFEQWMAFIKGPGWAPTLVLISGQAGADAKSGVGA